MHSAGKQLQVKNIFENNEVYRYFIYRKLENCRQLFSFSVFWNL